MKHLRNDTIITDITFTTFAKENHKTVKDIVKFAISDEDIDYNLENDELKQLLLIEPGKDDIIKYPVLDDNKNIDELIFKFSTANTGRYSYSNNRNLVVYESNYIEITCINDNNIFLKLFDINLIDYIIVDGTQTIDVANVNIPDIKINNTVKIFFNNYVNSGKIGFYSINRRFGKEFVINLIDITDLNPPIMTEPSNNYRYVTNKILSTDNSVFIKLIWNEVINASTYGLQVYNIDNNGNLKYIVNTNNVFDNISTAKELNKIIYYLKVSDFGKYYWKVSSVDNTGNFRSSNFSDVRVFEMLENKIQDSPSSPTVKLPAPIVGYPNSPLSDKNLTFNFVKNFNPIIGFSWNYIGGADKYKVQVSDDDNFNILLYDVETTNIPSSLTVPVINLDFPLISAKYYWRVQAINSINGDLTSNYSKTFSFEVKVNTNDVIRREDNVQNRFL